MGSWGAGVLGTVWLWEGGISAVLGLGQIDTAALAGAAAGSLEASPGPRPLMLRGQAPAPMRAEAPGPVAEGFVGHGWSRFGLGTLKPWDGLQATMAS